MCCENKHRWDSWRWNDEYKQEEASREKHGCSQCCKS